MSAAARAESARKFEVQEGAAIDAAYAVLEAGKAVRAARRQQDELDVAAKRHQDNVMAPAMQRFHEAQAEWRKHANAATGTVLELAS